MLNVHPLAQIEIAKNYGTLEWHEDLKTCLMKAGVDDKSVVFLFNDTQANQTNASLKYTSMPHLKRRRELSDLL